MAKKPKCMLTVDVEALALRAPAHHVDSLIYGRFNGEGWGIGRMMDIADKHQVKLTFFLDFAETELYGEDIIQAGRYIASRGHDLQIHCHYNLLENQVRNRFPEAAESYYTWYEDEAVSEFLVDYCLEQYRKCTDREPIVFRGGEYRVGKALLKKLKEKKVAADASYNYIRPVEKPMNRQFVFENGLFELPVAVLPEKEGIASKVLNFNEAHLYPVKEADLEPCLKEYEKVFREFYDCYGKNTLAAMVMHSWSFCYEKERFQSSGYMDRPNIYAAEFFDRFLAHFKGKYEFITAAQAVTAEEIHFSKTIDFDAVFSLHEQRESREKFKWIESFIKEKARGRRIIIWGKGWIEGRVMRIWNLSQQLDAAFYISRDADKKRLWRRKPVKTFEEAELSRDKDYVLVIANTRFPEIRDSLHEIGFVEFEDYIDIAQPLPDIENGNEEDKEYPACSICGGNKFVPFNSKRPRYCEGCGSVERNRTIPLLFSENLGTELLSKRILHVSPSRPERIFFEKTGAKNITTLDVRPQVKPDIVADLCDMPQVESESFEIVFANCVLNHVYDDNAALAEVCRVLKGNGLFIVWVMGSGGMCTTIDQEPAAWYGQETMDTYRVGTYRHYGERDFYHLLMRYFAEVHAFEKYDAPSEMSCCWYVCKKKNGAGKDV